MKRYQECNTFIKILRHRWYILIPFKWVYHMAIENIKIHKDEIIDDVICDTGEFDYPDYKLLWSILIGEAQGKMNWYYTMDEVEERFKNYF